MGSFQSSSAAPPPPTRPLSPKALKETHPTVEDSESHAPDYPRLAAMDVLQSPELVGLILPFQEGIYEDMVPFCRLTLPTLPDPDKLNDPDVDPDFAALHAVLSPWIARFGTSRLDKLFACQRHMHHIVLLHSIYYCVVDHVFYLYDNDLFFATYYPHIDLAAINGQARLLPFLDHIGCRGTMKAIDGAAQNGHLEVIQWLVANRLDGATERALDGAAAANHLAVVAFLDENRRDGATTAAMDLAATNGHLDMIRYLHTYRREGCTTKAMDGAAANGHLEVVQFLHECRPEGCTTRAMEQAATHGHLDVVVFLHDHRTEGCRVQAVDGAASHGHVDVVEWLLANRTEGLSTAAMDGAAANGHLAMVEWLHNHRNEGCTTKAINHAATNGHLEVVQWLAANRTEGCSGLALDGAATNGYLDIVQFLHTNYPALRASVQAMNGAARNGHLAVVQWWTEHRKEGCTTVAMDDAAENGHLEVVQYLHAHRTEGCTTKAMDGAAKNGHLDMLKYLDQNRHEGCTGQALFWAEEKEFRAMAKWLKAKNALEWSSDEQHSFRMCLRAKVAQRVSVVHDCVEQYKFLDFDFLMDGFLTGSSNECAFMNICKRLHACEISTTRNYASHRTDAPRQEPIQNISTMFYSDMFVPARFLEGSAAWQAVLILRKGKSHRLFFMPFGLGSMQCIAYRFVLTEMRVTLATMASQFDVELTENADLRYKFNGFKMAPVKFEIRLHRAVQKHPKE
ncbi:Aste57867_11766 [Aphanomyces stellatus]|uniref:Aste57867_11766 protein n=1 Tax=Aphanomyces stellatus TaxID=120398 RepID=A0A485KV13_9STRA|nr:hypothetical protein As57867_011721 [Aphanomyces stellatus]VFT88622.1 Aste57867_11766 [Aphanomyces stellatus]